MEDLKVGQLVYATITKNGYWQGQYKGVIVGFTSNNRVKVDSRRGIKIHSRNNIKTISPNT